MLIFLGSLTPFSSVFMVQIQEYIMYEMDLMLLFNFFILSPAHKKSYGTGLFRGRLSGTIEMSTEYRIAASKDSLSKKY